MEEQRDYQLVSADQTALKKELAKPDPGATPFKVVVDPEMRLKLRRALIELIDYHDEPWPSTSPKGNSPSNRTRNTSSSSRAA